jgi:N-methylhydantoinase B
VTVVAHDPGSFVLGPSPADWPALDAELAVDPVTFEIVRHKLEAINEEQGIALKAVSASPVVSEASDFGNGLYLPDGQMVSMGPEIVFQAGCMPLVIRHVLADCGERPGIEEGDMFAVNDPYKGAIHHPDISLVAPVHVDGELVAWTGVTAHQVDVGGMSIGSLCAKAKEKHQEGLMLPPVKLVERGAVRDDVWRLILNMTRQPQMVGLDLRGFIASNLIAARRFRELVAQYGVDTVKTVMRELIRYSERRFRQRLLELPNAQARSQGFIDHDGHANRIYRTDLVVTKEDDTLRLDFSGSSAQAPGFINCTEAGLVGGVFGGVAPLLAPGIPWTHGIFNALEIVAPPGLVCNARSPAPTSSATISEAWMIVNTVVHAVSKLVALSDGHRRLSQAVTNGTFHSLHIGERNQHGEPYGTHLMEAQLGGGGASALADGLDQSGGFPSLRPRIPNVETSEMHGPLLYLYRSSFADSGGDGRRRGGRSAGVAVMPYGVERLRCVFTTQGIQSPVSPGLFGGRPGASNRHRVLRGTDVAGLLAGGRLTLATGTAGPRLDASELGGEVEEPEAKTDEFEVRPGDVLEYGWAGGGGYGDPLLREPGRVLADVRSGIVTPERAEEAYGVVLAAGGVDEASTRERRAELRRERLRRCEPPPREPGGRAGERVAQLGPALYVARSGALQLECDCGQVFCGGEENWKLFAGRIALRGRQGALLLHEELELVEYLCTACGTLHAAEVKACGTEPIQDVKLVDGAFP